MGKKIILKTLVVTFDDNTPEQVVEEVRHILMSYRGEGVFTVQDGIDVEEIPDTEAKYGKKG